jgi:type IV secretory pathway TrbD component
MTRPGQDAVAATARRRPASPAASVGPTGMVAGVLQTVFPFLLVAGFGVVAWAGGYVAYRMIRGQH